MHEDLGLPNPQGHTAWQEWGSLLIRRLSSMLQTTEIHERELLLASTLTTAIDTATWTNIGFNQSLHRPKLFRHETVTNPHIIKPETRGEFILNADLGFVGTADFDVQVRTQVGGVEYGTLARSRQSALGTWFAQVPLVGVLLEVAKGSEISIAAQANVAGVSLAAGRVRLHLRRLA